MRHSVVVDGWELAERESMMVHLISVECKLNDSQNTGTAIIPGHAVFPFIIYQIIDIQLFPATSDTREPSGLAARGKVSTRGAPYGTGIPPQETAPRTAGPPGTVNQATSMHHTPPMPGASVQPDNDSSSSDDPPNSDPDEEELHAKPYIRCLLLMVAFLHTKHQVSFRACALILSALAFIFTTIPGNLLGGQRLPLTLTTIFSRLELRDRFKVHPVCHICHRIFDWNAESTMCPNCDEALYRPQTRQLFRRLFVAEQIGDGDDNLAYNAKRTPHMVAPIQTLSDGLQDFFSRPGMIPAVNAWKTRHTIPGELKSMQDAEVWRKIKGPDNTSFFFGPSSDNEIRLGVTLSLDW
ncbi:hypothetical protein C8R44DRAFT_749152 [Mycena epipterygia]|nr:hypothetical protein C8R44DRAFT_749152 [Mycena epipterygia]